VITSHLLDVPVPTPATDLQRLLFDDPAIHEPWRRLFSSPPYAFQEGLTHHERIELSYQRLRLVNAAIPDARTLVHDAAALSALHEWAGVDAGMATIISIHYNLFLGSLLDHDHQHRDLGPYLRMERVGTYLCTELAHGNDALQMETTAVFDRAAGEFVLTSPNPGSCKWMPNTSTSGGPKDGLVAARLMIDGKDHGVFLFLTPLTDGNGRHLPGVEVQPLHQTASAPVDHCATFFRGVRLPRTAMLQGDHGRLTPEGEFVSPLGSARRRFLHSIGRVTMGKICMSAYSLGAMRHALAVAVRYAHQRTTSDMNRRRVPLFAHRTHYAPLVEALATTYAATMLQRTVVRRLTEGDEADQEATERMTAVAKGWITWQARDVLRECRERCGAQGLALANGIAGHLSAVEGAITAEGDNVVIWLKAGGEMLIGGFKPRPTPNARRENRLLSDPQHLQDLLADLERIRYERASSRIRAKASTPLERLNRASSSAIALIDAMAHSQAAEALLAAARQAASRQAGQLLEKVHGLFVLRYLNVHRNELLEHGRLTAEQSRQLPDAAEAAVDALAPHALTLIDAFNVPEELTARHPMLESITPAGTVLA
jgi:acyl-CoA oxidase